MADVPLLVKIAPDLADDDVLDVAALALELRLDGIIATNTTISRDGLRTPAAEVEAHRRRWPVRRTAGRPVAGGAAPAEQDRGAATSRSSRWGASPRVEDARARLEAGATLVQAYTGFVYGGPWWPRRVAAGL